jgi:CRISPR-associated protein Cmr1
MKTIILKCKIIIPMFMSGADGRNPELRPSEFKGMMRFWWRAMRADDNIEKLRKDEAKIFGGSGEEQGKSKVIIKVYPQPKKEDIGFNIKRDFNLQWQYNRNTNSLEGEDIGIGYLLYSATLPNKERAYIKPDFQFNIELSSYDEESFKNALASLWAAIYLGGFGTRARRGAGNIETEVVDLNEGLCELSFKFSVSSKTDLKNQLKENLDKIFKIVSCNNGTTLYSVLKNSRIVILDPEDSWQKALDKVGNIIKKFRENNKSDIFNMGAFGMPIMHNGFKVRIVPYENTNNRVSERMASPLIIKLIKVEKNYFPVIVRLSTNLPLAGKERKERNNWKKEQVQEINLTKIDEFLNKIKNKEEMWL